MYADSREGWKTEKPLLRVTGSRWPALANAAPGKDGPRGAAPGAGRGREPQKAGRCRGQRAPPAPPPLPAPPQPDAAGLPEAGVSTGCDPESARRRHRKGRRPESDPPAEVSLPLVPSGPVAATHRDAAAVSPARVQSPRPVTDVYSSRPTTAGFAMQRRAQPPKDRPFNSASPHRK